MTYEQILNVNKHIKTTNIKGKNYAEVNGRIDAFRKLYPEGCISTEIISLADGMVVMKASIIDDSGRLLATGTAYEKETSSYINKTSYIENCETSAVGRALAMLGIGIDVSVASYEEVENAINNQMSQEDVVEEAKLRAKILKYIGDNEEPKAVEKYIKKTYECGPNDMNKAQCEHFIKTLEANGKEIK